MKKLFTNYNFEFNKNERKLLSTFAQQTLKQVRGDNKFFAEERAFNSIVNKLNDGQDVIKLTKEERIKLLNQLENNIKYLREKTRKSWFIKKWLYKSMLNQYEDIVNSHFKD